MVQGVGLIYDGWVTWSLIYTTGLLNNLIVGAGREAAFAAALLKNNALMKNVCQYKRCGLQCK